MKNPTRITIPLNSETNIVFVSMRSREALFRFVAYKGITEKYPRILLNFHY